MYTKLLIKNLYLTLKYIKYLNSKSGVLTLQSFDSLALRKTSDYLKSLDKCYSDFFNKICVYLYQYIAMYTITDSSARVKQYELGDIYNIMSLLLNNIQENYYIANTINSFLLVRTVSYKAIALLSMLSTFKFIRYFHHSLKVANIPKKVRKFTVLRSPHVDKKSREQFELRRFKCASKIYNSQAPYLSSLFNMRLPSGIGVSISYTKNRI